MDYAGDVRDVKPNQEAVDRTKNACGTRSRTRASAQGEKKLFCLYIAEKMRGERDITIDSYV